MYVKPDTVSYTSNILPGQNVYHKPLVKKSSAELKCIICDTTFCSLDDMRNHVKNLCQKNENQVDISEATGTEESEFGHIKITRAECDDTDLLIQSGTALSVLAEASQHVELLAQGCQEQVIEDGPQTGEIITQHLGDSYIIVPLDNRYCLWGICHIIIRFNCYNSLLNS